MTIKSVTEINDNCNNKCFNSTAINSLLPKNCLIIDNNIKDDYSI